MHSALSLFFTSASLAIEAQQVMALRLIRLAAGDASAERELQRMLWEKLQAANQAGVAAMMAMAGGRSGTAIALGTLRRYRTRVRRNRRRLLR